MKLIQITLGTVLMAAFSAPTAFAQSASNAQSPSREAVRAEAVTSHKDGTMVHNEAGQDKK